MTVDWTIREGSPNWECDWKGSELFHLRHFRSLSATEKFKAVENMCETAEYFKRKADDRRRAAKAEITAGP